MRGGRGCSKYHVTNFLSYSQWNRSLGMVGRAWDVGVFLSDDLYMSNAGVMGVPTMDIGLGKEHDERSIMSQISLVIHSMISSICTSTQSHNSHFTTDKSRNITITELEALVSRVIHLSTRGRVSFQLTLVLGGAE